MPTPMDNGKYPTSDLLRRWVEQQNFVNDEDRNQAIDVTVLYDETVGFSRRVEPNGSNYTFDKGTVRNGFSKIWTCQNQSEDDSFHYQLIAAQMASIYKFQKRLSEQPDGEGVLRPVERFTEPVFRARYEDKSVFAVDSSNAKFYQGREKYFHAKTFWRSPRALLVPGDDDEVVVYGIHEEEYYPIGTLLYYKRDSVEMDRLNRIFDDGMNVEVPLFLWGQSPYESIRMKLDGVVDGWLLEDSQVILRSEREVQINLDGDPRPLFDSLPPYRGGNYRIGLADLKTEIGEQEVIVSLFFEDTMIGTLTPLMSMQQYSSVALFGQTEVSQVSAEIKIALNNDGSFEAKVRLPEPRLY